MSGEVNVEVLISEPYGYLNQTVCVGGVIFVRDGRVTICSNDVGEGICLDVIDKGLIDRLLDSVPCYVGGEFLYRDRVTIMGTLCADTNGVALTAISNGCLSRCDQEFEF
jgi:hypothetical protein